jgi:hypothetical protein
MPAPDELCRELLQNEVSERRADEGVDRNLGGAQRLAAAMPVIGEVVVDCLGNGIRPSADSGDGLREPRDRRIVCLLVAGLGRASSRFPGAQRTAALEKGFGCRPVVTCPPVVRAGV